MATFIQKIHEAKQLIQQTQKQYPNSVFACSFGKDSMVVLHLLKEINPKIPVFTVFMDTEFPETVSYTRKIAKDWNLNYSEHWVHQGPISREECCGKGKVEKHKEILQQYDAWYSGIRKTEGITRANFQSTEKRGHLVKINPILEFTELDVWRYLTLNEIPVNPKYKEGFRSLGCGLCSTPEADESLPERAGRWQGTKRAGGECGIHTECLSTMVVEKT